ncbi:MAG TPA: acyltransferase domain-containing protein [Steroidobacteraceae bacterium]|nr:acyltransferase domain-containing protein [Steroidobacteraceae bacterium]
MRLALLFPGQGTHTPGFLGRLPAHPAVDLTLSEARDTLGDEALRLDSAAALESTAAVQLTTVIAGVAVARALAAEGCEPDAVAGLSVGAFTAAVVSGVLTFPQALGLVKLRGEAMAQAVPHGHGMTAILGLSERDARALIARVTVRAPLYLASVNGPSEVVVSGAEAALELAAAEAHAAGAAARRLRLTIPSHCPLMAGVSERLRTALQGVTLRAPRALYVSNTRARAAREARAVAEDLIANVSHTVRWHDSVTLLFELGCRCFIETPPGAVLSNLVRDSFPEARAVALEEVPLATAAALAARRR